MTISFDVVVWPAQVMLIEPSLLSETLGRDTDVWDYVRIAWLASALGTIGGALGATLETDEAVREAAYAHRPTNARGR